MTQYLKIGVDGGGTKTELIVTDSGGRVLASHTAPGCNPSHVGSDSALSILETALHDLLERLPATQKIDGVVETHLFLAGNPIFWREACSKLSDWGRVITAADSLPVLELATNGGPGLVLHSGTGSFVAARAADGSLHYAGGMGWKIGDPGSAFDLGRRGIARGLLEIQGWAERSGIDRALCSHTGMDDASAITRLIYSAPDANARIASFAPQVIALANDGCRSAQLLLVHSLTELVDQARGVSDRLFPGVAPVCGVSGALLNSVPASHTLRSLVATQSWQVELRFIDEPPIEGVRRLLAKS